MGKAGAGPMLAGYLESVSDSIEAGHDFGEIEKAIDAIVELPEDGRAALWLFAFSKSDGTPPRRVAPRHLFSVN